MMLNVRGETGVKPAVGMLFSMVAGNDQRLKSVVEGISQEEMDFKGPDGDDKS